MGKKLSCVCCSFFWVWFSTISVTVLAFAVLGLGIAASLVPEVGALVTGSVFVGIITLGTVMVIASALGIVGLCMAPKAIERQRKNWALIIYLVLVCVIFIAVAFVTTYCSQVYGAVSSGKANAFSDNLDAVAVDSFEADQKQWLSLQDKFDCCGYQNVTGLHTGEACFVNARYNVSQGDGTWEMETELERNYNALDCKEKLYEEVESNFIMLLVVFSLLNAVLVIAIAGTIALFCAEPQGDNNSYLPEESHKVKKKFTFSGKNSNEC